MQVLAIDPGFKALGYAVYDSKKDAFLTWGAVLADPKEYKATKKLAGASKADAFFMTHIADRLTEVYVKHSFIERVIFELPHGGMNFRSVKMLAIVTGTVIGWATAYDLPLSHFTQERNKKCATGDIRASKGTMQLAVRKHWPTADWSSLEDKELEHICDAAGLIIAAQHDDVI